MENFLIPHLGKLCLADLDVRRRRAAFGQIAKTTNSKGQPQSQSCLRHVSTTLWFLIALRGLRRGEACGLRWCEIDLDHGVLFVVINRTTAGYDVIEGDPKTAAGIRAVALDRHTVAVLREHRRRQLEHRDRRLAADKIWHDSG